jgi:hydrogenase maturation factor
LLIALPDADALALLAELQKSGHREAAIIGRVTTRADFPLELV